MLNIYTDDGEAKFAISSLPSSYNCHAGIFTANINKHTNKIHIYINLIDTLLLLPKPKNGIWTSKVGNYININLFYIHTLAGHNNKKVYIIAEDKSHDFWTIEIDITAGELLIISNHCVKKLRCVPGHLGPEYGGPVAIRQPPHRKISDPQLISDLKGKQIVDVYGKNHKLKLLFDH
jgi:hypothetical protein